MKNIISLILLVLSSVAYGQLSLINVGTAANDGTGESLRSAFQKVNLGITQINTNTGNIALKLAIADTSNMLLRYINKADTALMLSNYAKISATMSTSHAANAITGTDITNWGTAYTDRLKWDGGSTGLTAATGRTSLGGTTAGQALFTLSNPSAITFLRVNADNSVTALSAANFRTATATLGVADTATMLADYINKADTAAMLSKYLLITDTVGLGGGASGIQASDTASMLTPYITDHEARKAINDSLTARLNGATEISDVAVMLADSTGGSGHYASHYDMVTGLAGKVAIADTADMLTDYINKADTATMLSKYAKLTDIAEGGISLSAVQEAIADSAVLLSDIRPYYTFGAGTGAAADSTLFAKGNKSFGSFRIIEDSLYVHSITNLYMTSGDSLKFNVYYGNGMTRTATDSLFTAPQGAGSYATQTLTPDNERTINHGQDVWVGIIGPQPANMRPKEWILQLNAKIVRD